MNIIAIREIFKTQFGFYLPNHPDFSMKMWNEVDDYTYADAFIQSNIAGRFKCLELNPLYEWVKKKPVLCMEQAIFRKNMNMHDTRNYYFRLGLNSYTYDKGVFKNKNSPPDRWKTIQEKCEIEIKPWKTKGDYILILLQNPHDTSLVNLKTSYDEWIVNTVREISSYTSEDIVIRLHPNFVHKFNIPLYQNINVPNRIGISGTTPNNNISHGGKDFEDTLANARMVVAFSSNGLQEAVCEGVPAISLDTSSFAWPVSYHSLDILGEGEVECKFERDQWLYDCGYCQWTADELDSGYPHKRLLE